ncbi:MAG: helix-turn-helix transcriptional regulator [Mucilaginibacter sp.]|jgi:transcriptional regulator with XRE-family HTH domain|uniref:helix-turn-helix transcriptional regulator n=1 Tax=Mucilaginibacter sp. TaxID=1882438 RepID=UPI003564F5E4
MSGTKSPIDIYVVAKVREMRLKAGYSQVALAVQLELSPGFIGHVESFKSNASYNLRHLNKLAAIFKCSPKDFFPDEYLDGK